MYTDQLRRVHDLSCRCYPALVGRKTASGPRFMSQVLQEKIQDLDSLEILPHPAYSSDLTQFFTFRSMEHLLRGGCFKPMDWFRQDLASLVERWRRNIDIDGLVLR